MLSLFISFAIFLGLYSFRNYDKENMGSFNEQIIRTIAGTIIGFVIILLFYIFIPQHINRFIFIYNFTFAVIVFPLIHIIEYKIYIKRKSPTNYIVIGKKEEIGDILEEISKKTLNKKRFVEFINPSPTRLDKLVEERILNEDIRDKARNNKKNKYKKNVEPKIDRILVADPYLEGLVKPELKKYKSRGIKVEYLPNMVEKDLKRIPIKVAEKFKEYYEVIFENISYSPIVKIFDIIFSLILLVLSSPFILSSMVAIVIDDIVHKEKIEIFFKQKRYGQNDKIFKVYKLKTMRRIIKKDGTHEDVTTKTGKYLRKFRLNELPQILNILKGDMSLVGPRPDINPNKQFCEERIPFYNYRTNIQQGITGHAQVLYKYQDFLSVELYSTRLSYDLYYVKHYGLFLYIITLLRTVETIIMGRGK